MGASQSEGGTESAPAVTQDRLKDTCMHLQSAGPEGPPSGITPSSTTTSNALSTADGWKRKGNEEFGKGLYSKAVVSYTTALFNNPTTEESLTIRNNRVLAYLKQGQLDEAVSEGTELASISQTEEKALFRTGQAYHALEDFEASAAILSKLCQKYPTQAQAKACLKRVKDRLDEQQTGKYEFLTLNKEAAGLRPPELDHATFDRSVVVKNSPSRGRGLFTAMAVKAGDLLLCEKAFAHVHKEYIPPSGGLLDCQTINEQLVSINTQSELVGKLVAKTSKSRSFYKRVTDLFHGPFHPASAATNDDGTMPSLDSSLAREIVRLNAFSSDLITRDKHLGHSASNKTKHYCTGLWLRASMINHCCFSNARRAFIGDMLIVRASRDLPAGTEVTFTYNRPNGDGEDMQAGLLNWGFICVCAACADWNETAQAVKRERRRLLADLETSLNKSTFNAGAAEVILQNVTKTYNLPATEVPRFALFAPYVQLAVHYQEAGDGNKCLSAVLNALTARGFILRNAALIGSSKNRLFEVVRWGVMGDDVVGAFVMLWNVYWKFQQVQNLDVVADCGRIAYKICVGEDDTYTQSYGDSSA